MILPSDFRDLLEVLGASRVKYVILGGYAVVFHGRPRATKDMDLFVRLDAENLQHLSEALDQFGAPRDVVDAARSMTASDILYFGAPPLRVDFLGFASGIEFDETYAHALVVDVDGVSTRIISLDDLITNKRASGRPRDIEDGALLERIRSRKAATK
ncbi:nucleotidyltransferase [Pendulispora brunnea]|uniref:Nucleotidyltransferase n=1 Tax=Pendulispora brunnea TaxID=2905690 RepID=A0ABZ2K8C1_9BACT